MVDTRPITKWLPREAMTADYIIYQRGSVWKALSRDPSYLNQRESELHSAINAASTERTSVGGKFFIAETGTIDVKGIIDFPTTTFVDWELEGLGSLNTVLQAHADLGANPMIRCNKTEWGSPQDNGATILKNINLDPNNIATQAVVLPYCQCSMFNVQFDNNIGDTAGPLIGRIGGSGGPSRQCLFDNISIKGYDNHTSASLWDLWVDQFEIRRFQISLGSWKRIFYFPGGDFGHITTMNVFLGANKTLDEVIYNGNHHLHIGYMSINQAGGDPASINDGIFRSLGSGLISWGQLYQAGIGGTAYLAYDATTRQDIRPSNTFTFAITGTLTTGTDKAPTLEIPADCYLLGVRLVVKTAPTGATIIVDVNLNGTTVFTTQGNRPVIAISATSGSTYTLNNGTDIEELDLGDKLTIDIDQVGSTVAGADLTVEVLTVAK